MGANQYSDTAQRDATMKLQYVTQGKTMKVLAGENKLSESCVQQIGRRDKWKQARTDYLAKLQDETIRDTAKGISTRVATINNKHFKTYEKMLNLINEALDNASTQLKYEDGNIKLGKLEAIAKVMLMIQQGQRLAKGMGDPIEVKKLEIAFKRLELEAKKLAGEPDEIPDDGFDEALDATAQRIWGDVNGTENAEE